MGHSGPGPKVDLPPGRSDAAAIIDFFEINEESLVKSAQRLKVLSSGQETRTDYLIHGSTGRVVELAHSKIRNYRGQQAVKPQRTQDEVAAIWTSCTCSL